MRTIAFVGPSGTGKSHRAMMVARMHGADAIIDDGLLISETRVIAGKSAKKEDTRIASVKCALFNDPKHAKEVSKAIYSNNISCIMLLGTSDGMVERIAKILKLPPIEKTIYITDIATEDEMNLAKQKRLQEGKHVIPVPTFAIKKDFSGYFLHPLKIFHKNMDNPEDALLMDKSIVRPTFSYLGDYTISDNVLEEIAAYECSKIDGVAKVHPVNVREGGHGAHLDIKLDVKFGYDILKVCKAAQHSIINAIEKYTSINARRVHIEVKHLIK